MRYVLDFSLSCRFVGLQTLFVNSQGSAFYILYHAGTFDKSTVSATQMRFVGCCNFISGLSLFSYMKIETMQIIYSGKMQLPSIFLDRCGDCNRIQ